MVPPSRPKRAGSSNENTGMTEDHARSTSVLSASASQSVGGPLPGLTDLTRMLTEHIFIKPVDLDQEVWFGIMLTGWWAKATAPLHWLIYAALAQGFRRMRRWMHPWAMLYALQVAMGMGVWSFLDPRGPGLAGGLLAFGLFLVPVVALWRARALFEGEPG